MLCFDEISCGRGQGNYVLVISAPELGCVLDVLPDRRRETLMHWLDQQGPDFCAGIDWACADMWDAYHSAIAAKLPKAKAVVDRFHVVKNLHDAISKTRRTIQRQAPAAVQEQLKGSRWALLKHPDHLTDKDKARLQAATEASPELKVCYELKEEFRRIFELTDPTQAQTELGRWLDRARATGYRAMLAFAKTVDHWQQSILNFFHGRWNNGFAEGVNQKIKLIKRRGFGYRNFDHFRLHILVAFDPTTS